MSANPTDTKPVESDDEFLARTHVAGIPIEAER
jgi:hypothetical protein